MHIELRTLNDETEKVEKHENISEGVLRHSFYNDLMLSKAAIGIVNIYQIIIEGAGRNIFLKFCLELFVEEYSYWKTGKINYF